MMAIVKTSANHSSDLLILQMVPLIKKSTDNLVAVIGEKAASEESFEVMKYAKKPKN